MDSWDRTTRASSSVIADHDVLVTDVKLTSKVASDRKIHWFKNYSFTYRKLDDNIIPRFINSLTSIDWLNYNVSESDEGAMLFDRFLRVLWTPLMLHFHC